MRVQEELVGAYTAGLGPPAATESAPARGGEELERRAAWWLTLDAINFGSGWFPTLRKAPGHSGYGTIAAGLRGRFDAHGAWSGRELCTIGAPELSTVLGQVPDHPLMALFAESLQDLGEHVCAEFNASFSRTATAGGGSAVRLAERLGGWRCFADTAILDGIHLPFLKRAQLAAADLARAGVVTAADLGELTMFADNLVPHVLRLDGILRYEDRLVARIEGGELLRHGSREEIEIRACALHAVELIVAAIPGCYAAEVDQILWNRGQQPRYKAVPRHRCRCTAY